MINKYIFNDLDYFDEGTRNSKLILLRNYAAIVKLFFCIQYKTEVIFGF